PQQIACSARRPATAAAPVGTTTGEPSRIAGRGVAGRCDLPETRLGVFDPALEASLILTQPVEVVDPAAASPLRKPTVGAPIWVSLPDAIAAKVLSPSDIAPRVLDAIRLHADPRPERLRSVSIRGDVEVDPHVRDLFAATVEEH